MGIWAGAVGLSRPRSVRRGVGRRFELRTQTRREGGGFTLHNRHLVGTRAQNETDGPDQRTKELGVKGPDM